MLSQTAVLATFIAAALLFTACSDNTPTGTTPNGSIVAAGGSAGSVSVGSEATITATVENKGGSDVTVTALTISPANALFTVMTPTVPFTLKTGAKQNITVRFRPTATGNQTTGLKISTSVGDTTVAISGSANASAASGFSMIINGAGMNNRKIEFAAPGASSSNSSVGTYAKNESATVLAIQSAAGQFNGNQAIAAVQFPGNSTGSFPFSNAKVSINLQIGSISTGELFTSDKDGTFFVTEYPAVGGNIKGTFNGTMDYITNNELKSVTVTGTFEAMRLPDQ